MDQTTDRPDDVYGICVDCKRTVTRAEWGARDLCCRNTIDYSWQAIANPHNVEWEPGYRFVTTQDSRTTNGKYCKGVQRNSRVYHVGFEVGRSGQLRWRGPVHGGIKPTERTMANTQANYERARPHLPLSREQLQHLVDSWEHANDPVSVAIAAKARALLEETNDDG